MAMTMTMTVSAHSGEHLRTTDRDDGALPLVVVREPKRRGRKHADASEGSVRMDVSPVEMAMFSVKKTHVNQPAFAEMLADVLSGAISVKFANDPRTSGGEEPMEVLRRYLEFSEDQKNTWTTWWRLHGKHATQLVQQHAPGFGIPNSVLRGRGGRARRQASDPSSGSGSGSSTAEERVANSPRMMVSVSHLKPAQREEAYDTVQEDMRTMVHSFQCLGDSRSLKPVKRAVRESMIERRTEYRKVASATDRFAESLVPWRASGALDSITNISRAERYVQDVERYVQALQTNYDPGFDRNDLLLTNAAEGKQIANGREVTVVALYCGTSPLYLTWCVQGKQDELEEGVRTSRIRCNASVEAVLRRPGVKVTHSVLVSPGDGYAPDELLQLIKLLETQVDATGFRAPAACNDIIPHIEHFHLYAVGGSVAAFNARHEKHALEAEIEAKMAEVRSTIGSFENQTGSLPELVHKLFSSGDNGGNNMDGVDDVDPDRKDASTARCLESLWDRAKEYSRVMGVAMGTGHSMIERYRSSLETYTHVIEREWVKSITDSTHTAELDRLFQNVRGKRVEKNPFLCDARVSMAKLENDVAKVKQDLGQWVFCKDLEWCRALVTLGLWDIHADYVGPPPSPRDLTKSEVATRSRELLRLLHPNQRFSAKRVAAHDMTDVVEAFWARGEVFTSVKPAKEYIIGVIKRETGVNQVISGDEQ
jgi:hypothetical protein